MRNINVFTKGLVVFGFLFLRFSLMDSFAQLRPFDNSRTLSPWMYNPAASFTGDFQAILAYDGRNSNSFTPQSLFAGVRIPVLYSGRDRRKPASMIGAQFLRTSQDLVQSSLLSGNFSYQVPLSKRLRAATGLGAGMSILNYNYDNLVFLDQQDPLLGNGVSFFNMHLNAGLSLVLDERLTLSAALPYILRENNLNLNEWIIRAAYEAQLGNDFDFLIAANLDTYNRNKIIGGDLRLQWNKTIAVLAGTDNFKAYSGVTLRFETISFSYTYGINYSSMLNRIPNNQIMLMMSVPPKSKYSR
jgi:hypothetical protein